MGRFVTIAWVALLVAPLSAAGGARSDTSTPPVPHPWIIVPAGASRDASFPDFVERLSDAGLRVSHVIPAWRAVAGIWTRSEVLRACDAAGGIAVSGAGAHGGGQLPSGGTVSGAPSPGSGPPSEWSSSAGPDPRLAAIARRWAEIRERAPVDRPDGRGPFDAPHIRPKPGIARPGAPERSRGLPPGPLPHRPFGAGILDVSEFLAGDVALGVIFPSSDGSIDPSTEDWTQAELDVQIAGILEGMEFWAARYPGLVRFFYRFEGEVPTGYEPIARPSGDDRLWVGDVLAALGYSSGNAYRAAYFYVDDLIRDLGTDWGGIYFSVDSSNDADGLFADGFPDYTYFGGPAVITPSTHGGDGEAETPTYAAHEFAHLFYANDEYFWAFEPCDARSGYLGAPNQNSAFWNCRFDEDCIMKVGYLPWTRNCILTTAQLGQYDRDADGIPDVLDTAPAATIDGDSLLVFREGDPMIVTGEARVSPAENRNPYGSGRAITTNTILSADWRLDGGPGTPALPGDGAFDSGVEPFRIDLGGLTAGTYRLEVIPTNDVGNAGLPALVDVRVDP